LEVSYVDSDGVKPADKADAHDQLLISEESTLVEDQEIDPGKPPHQSAGTGAKPRRRDVVQQARQPGVEH
jgi:hypothetical protein